MHQNIKLLYREIDLQLLDQANRTKIHLTDFQAILFNNNNNQLEMQVIHLEKGISKPLHLVQCFSSKITLKQLPSEE